MKQRSGAWETTHLVTTYRALLRAELSEVLGAAGFVDIDWHLSDASGFYQPVVTARKG